MQSLWIWGLLSSILGTIIVLAIIVQAKSLGRTGVITGIVFGSVMGEIGGIMLIIYAIAHNGENLFFGLGFSAFFILLWLGLYKLKKVDDAEEEKRIKEEKEEAAKHEAAVARQNAFIATLDNDSFKFNSLEFYNKCIENGISNIDDTFSKSKANLIIDQMLKAKKVPETYWERYHKRSNDLFLEGQKTSDFIKKQQEIANRKPKTGELDNSSNRLRTFNEKYSQHTGHAKSKAILEDTNDELRKARKEKLEGEEALRKFSGIMASSYSTQKTNDWAIQGGIASGIAGPAAGVAVAANAMVKNAQIEAQNRQNREAAMKMSATLLNGAYSVRGDADEILKQIDEVNKQIGALSLKVIITDISKSELMKSLTISSEKIRTVEKATSFEFTIKNTYKPDVPDNVHMAIDGAFEITLICDDNITIERVDVALPLFGVECGKSVTVRGVSPYYMEGNHTNFRIEVKPKNLWLVEI